MLDKDILIMVEVITQVVMVDIILEEVAQAIREVITEMLEHITLTVLIKEDKRPATTASISLRLQAEQ